MTELIVPPPHLYEEITLANRIRQFLAVRFKGKARRTIDMEKAHMDQFELFVRRRAITKNLLLQYSDFLDSKGYHANTINKRIMSVARFFKWCEEMDYIQKSPHNVLKYRPVRRDQPLPSIYTEGEYERIKEFTQGTWKYYVTVFGYRTGMSLVDICHLRWVSVNMDELYIMTNRIKMLSRDPSVFVVPILAESDLHVMLMEQRASSGKYKNERDQYVNPEMYGQYCFAQARLSEDYGRMLKKLDIRGRAFKNFRNTFISNVANSGMNLALATKMTGHKDPSVFASYVRPDVGAMKTGLQAAFQWAANKQSVKLLKKPDNQV